MKNFLRKLTSRKLWVAVAGLATGAALALGAETSDIGAVAGAVMAVVSVVTYVITEGKIDAESVKNAILAIQQGAEALEREDEA